VKIDTSNPTTFYASNFSTGTFAIFVLNSLAYPNNVPPSASIKMFVSASSDFELQAPRLLPSYLPILTTRPESGVVQEGDEESREPVGATAPVVKTMPLLSFFPENQMNLQDHLRRPFFRGDLVIDADASPNLPFSYRRAFGHTPFPFPGPPPSNFFTYFLDLYRFWNGPLRFIMHFHDSMTSNNVVKVLQTAEVSDTDATLSGTFDQNVFASNFSYLASLRDTPALEFTASWFTNLPRLVINRSATAALLPLHTCSAGRIILAGSFPTATRMEVYHMLADETRLSYFIGPPQLQLVNPTSSSQTLSVRTCSRPGQMEPIPYMSGREER